MRIQVRHDGSVSIVVSDKEFQYLAPPNPFWVNEFEIVDGKIENFEQRKLK